MPNKILLGTIFVILCISNITSIVSISNEKYSSGQTDIANNMTKYYVIFTIFTILLCISSLHICLILGTAQRQKVIFIFAGVAYILSMCTLHLSCIRTKTNFT